jgi:hypothetical protein
MTQLLSNDGFKKALAILFSAFRHLEPAENKDFIYKAWFRMLQDIPDCALLDAVTRFVTENKKLYPGDNFIAMLRELAIPTLQETEGDAIELAFEAVRKFGYMQEHEALQWLDSKSPLISAVVRRIGYRDICMSEEPDVVRGQIRAVFKSEKERAVRVGGVVESALQLNNGIVKTNNIVSLTNCVKRLAQ